MDKESLEKEFVDKTSENNAMENNGMDNDSYAPEMEILEDGDAKQCADKKLSDEYLDKLQRTLAEFDNFRKRTAKEKAGMYSDGVRDTIEKLLPSIDNFERAVAAATNKNDNFYKGVEMIYRQIMLALEDMGVHVIAAVGEPFDPNIHHAVAHADDPSFGENEVAEELQKGYMYKDKVIRPSMVKVAN